jgi:hypothetical protein
MLGTAQQQIYNRAPGKAATPDITTQIGTDPEGNPIMQTTPGTPATSGEITGFKPYVPYGATVDASGNITNTAQEQANAAVAGFSPMQQQAFKQAGEMQVPGQFGFGSNLAALAGQGQLGTTGQAASFGQMGSQYGDLGTQTGMQGGGTYGGMGAGYGAQGAQLGILGGGGFGQMGAGYGAQGANMSGMGFGAGQRFEQMATDPRAQQAYMSPYMQNVVDFQKQQAIRDYGIASQGRNYQAVKSGAFGGSRQAVAEGEANRALMNQLGGIQATGTQQAFSDAQKQMQFGADLGLRGLGAGYQGLGLGIQGAQTGLQGVNTQLAGTAQGIQGAQTGLQGVNTQLAGTAQGMQGAQIGLQGVGAQQAGFAGANQAASTLGQLGSQQLAAQQGILDTQSRLGAQQQQLEQQKVNQSIQNYAMQQQYPMQQLAAMSGLLRGLPLQSATTQSYQAAPSAISQIGGLGLTGAAAYGLMKKEGGVIKSYAEGGAVEGDGIARFDAGGDINRKVLLNPNKYSAQMIDRSTKNGIIDDIVGLAALKEKNEDAKTRKAQAASGQGKPPTIKDQLLAEAQQLQGIDNAQSNLPTEYAGGGIVAFNGEDGSQVRGRSAFMEDIDRFRNYAKEPGINEAIIKKLKGVGSYFTTPRQSPRDADAQPGGLYGSGSNVPPEPVAKPDTGIKILPNEPRAKPPIMNPPAAAPTKDTGMSGIDDLIRQSIGDIKASGESSKDARKEAKLMAMMQAGLGIASGTSPFALANVKGAIPALQGYQEEMRGIRGDEAKQIAQIAALNLKGAELKNELRKQGISEELYKAQAKYYNARANAPIGGAAGLGGAVPPNVTQKVMGEYKGYLANPKAAPFFSSLPKNVQTGLTDYGPKTKSYQDSLAIFRQYAHREMMNELNFYGSLNRRSPATATSSLLED